MSRLLLRFAASTGFVSYALAGCNSLLDNEPAYLVASNATVGLVDDAGPAESTATPDATVPDTAKPPPVDDPACPAGQRQCFGTCVAHDDPRYGCGDPSCAPCPSARATMGCQGPSCVIATCDKGYADCNHQAADGCEVDLSKPTSCGACNARCGAASPLCGPSGASFQCTNGCTSAAPLACGAECVNPNTSVNHCGGCNKTCPAVANGTVTCANAACALACKVGFHACGGKCVATTNPAFCGTACTPCPAPAGGTATCTNDVCQAVCPVGKHLCSGKCIPDDDISACGAGCAPCAVPPNAAATCTAGNCGFTCAPRFADCDTDRANGCEVNLATSTANCGACGRVCGPLEMCLDGTCRGIGP